MSRDHFRKSPLLGYGLALVVWAVAFGLRYGLAHWFPPGFPYLTFFPAVVLTAYYAGLRPAILTAVLSGLTAWWFWIGPPGFDVGTATLVALAFYAFVVAVDIFFIVGMEGATRRLAEQVQRNADLAHSRDLLLREVQHRVSNNIQVVSALLKLEARGATEPAARKVLTEAAARTAMIARLQRNLCDTDGRATAFAAVADSTLADALAASGRSDIALTITGDDIVLSAEEATPLLLILLESVNNALEHAFADRPGQITVRLEQRHGRRTLTVADDGQGLPEGFSAEMSDTMGLRLVRGMAQQLGGAYRLEARPQGSIAILDYPCPA